MSLTFSIDVIPEEDGVGYFVIVPSLPGCFSQGATVEEAIKNAREAIAVHVKALKKQKVKFPKREMVFHTAIEVAA